MTERTHGWWWLHDARWYQGVARRFGQPAANDINAEALAFVGRRVAVAHRARLAGPPRTRDEAVTAVRAVATQMWPSDMVEAVIEPDGDDAWTTEVRSNYALGMLGAAGALEGYASPCGRLRRAWFTGLGLDATDERESCVLDGAPTCRYRSRLAAPADQAARDEASVEEVRVR